MQLSHVIFSLSSTRSKSSLSCRIDSDNIVHCPCPDISLPDREHIFDFVWKRSSEQWGDRTALVRYDALNEDFT